jgi:hypothetical protein
MMTSLITMFAAVSSQHGVTARSRIGFPAIVVGSDGSRISADDPPGVADLQSPKTPTRPRSGSTDCQALGPTETV